MILRILTTMAKTTFEAIDANDDVLVDKSMWVIDYL